MRSLPHISLGRLLVAVVPFAAYLSLARAIVEANPRENPLAMAAIAFLLGLSGVAVAAYRRVGFPETMIQLTTTPLAVLAMWQTLERVVPEYRPVAGWSWLIVIGASLVRFAVEAADRRSPGPARAPWSVVSLIDAFAAGFAQLGLFIPVAFCCTPFLPR